METYIMYKFTCNDENVISSYVGHTKCFKTRKRGHKTNCNNENSKAYNVKLYTEIRANGGWDNWIMCPIEEYKCDSKLQARIREQYHINLQAEKLNIHSAFTSAEEEVIKNNKYNNEHKELRKQYNYLHKEKIHQQQHDWYLKKRDEILAKHKVRYECICGSSICETTLPRHIATLKHQQYILSQPIV